MKGKSKAYPHRKIKDGGQKEVPKLSMDYAYMSNDKTKKDEGEKGDANYNYEGHGDGHEVRASGAQERK